jgi:hypothetical protein
MPGEAVTAELLPCPFCGGPAKEIMGLIGCAPCALARRDATSWNRRAPAIPASELEGRIRSGGEG